MAVVEAEIVEGGRWKFASNYDIIDGCLPYELTLEILFQLPVKSLVNLSFHKYDPVFCDLIGSCDGLICMYSPRDKCIYIFNPLTKETKEISTPYHKSARRFLKIEGASWFGFVPSINDYMIWLVVTIPTLNLRIHVYSMRDDNWRELDNTRFIDVMVGGMNAVVMNGTLHCSFNNDYNEFMVKYDLVQDIIELERIKLNHNQDKYYNEPSIGILQDSSLCICKVDSFYGVMDVWKLDQDSNSDSWNKLFSLDLGLPQFVFLLGFTSNGRISVRSSSNELEVVDPNQNPPLQVRLGTIDNYNNRCRLFELLEYSESLVSPFSLP
ncbi:putative F-box protein At1g12855 [Spinacia oleracea]|uniref:F-box protein At1g12855 n=1 Tax=Spinacia oleracea TaxID=3562 RepID=A0ABM3REC6_SPIOL|nr:putative F-box protein At1g12855 [Spinacia oleracea]